MIVLDLSILNQRGTPMFYSDIFANRPPAGVVGRIFISIDTFAFYRDTGTGWDLIGGPGTGTITGAGTATQVAFFSGASSVASDSNLYWDNTGKHLGIGTASPNVPLDVQGAGVIARLNGTGTSNTFLEFQHAGTNKWRVGNAYQAGANYLQIFDHDSSIERLRWDNTGAAQLAGNFIFTASTTNDVAKFRATEPNLIIESTGVSNPANLSFNPTANFGSVIQATNTGGFIEIKTGGTTNLLIKNNKQVVVGSASFGNSLFEVAGTAYVQNNYTQAAGAINTGLQSYTTATTPAGSSYTNGIAYIAFNGAFQNNFGGNNTVPNSVYMAGIRGNAAIGFTANSVITVNQGPGSKLRSISNLVNQFSVPTNGAGSTISHASGLHIYAPILAGTSPTFTNYYGVAINDSAEYAPTITNRWGIYQDGTTDKNYFAADVLIGSSVNSGEKLQVTGTSKFSTQITISAGDLQFGSNAGYGLLSANSTRILAITNTTASFNSDVLIGQSTNANGFRVMIKGSAGSTDDLGINTNASYCEIQSFNSKPLVLNRQGNNVGIGTASPAYVLDVQSSVGTARLLNTTAPPTGGVVTLLLEGTNNFSGVSQAYIKSLFGGANGQTNLTFGTSGTLDASATERMRITAAGEFLVGTSNGSATAGNGFKIYSGSGNADGVSIVTGATTDGGLTTYTLYSTGAAAYRFYVGAGGTIFATNTTISGISDIRLKENIQDIDVGLNAIMALKPRKFDWKQGKGKDIKGDRGWIAQEFEKVFPDMIDNWKDPNNQNSYKSVRADLIPVLVKAIQELKFEIDKLKK